MVRFHVSPDGVARRCNAGSGEKSRGCKYGLNDNEHYATKEEAQKIFELKNKQNNFRIIQAKNKNKKYAPDKPEIVQPTIDEALENLIVSNKYLRENSKDGLPYTVTNDPKNIIMFGLTGSSLYGLQHPDSDRDLSVIVQSNFKKDFNHVFDNGMDVRLQSLEGFTSKLAAGKLFEIDSMVSGDFIVPDNSPYKHYIEALRYNKYSYLETLHKYAIKDLETSFIESKSPKRREKLLKTCLRSFIIYYRNLDNMGLNIKFDDNQRENFYKSFEKLKKCHSTARSENSAMSDKDFNIYMKENMLDEVNKNL